MDEAAILQRLQQPEDDRLRQPEGPGERGHPLTRFLGQRLEHEQRPVNGSDRVVLRVGLAHGLRSLPGKYCYLLGCCNIGKLCSTQ
jgi:hypothetical protein